MACRCPSSVRIVLPVRTVSKGTQTLPKPSDSMPRIRRQEGGTLIVLGPGAIQDLRPLLRELGSTRPDLVTGPHLAGGPVGSRARPALADGLLGSYPRAPPPCLTPTPD